MEITEDLVRSFRCPRWQELPTIPLYMDQVIYILSDSLKPLFADDKAITSTMINNYVKQKVIAAPVNKKYTRAHLAELIVIVIMKRVFSMNEIVVMKQSLIAMEGIERAYELFCERLEAHLLAVFAAQPVTMPGRDDPLLPLDMAMTALMGKLFVQNFVEKKADGPA